MDLKYKKRKGKWVCNMELDMELLRKICKRYGVTLIENQSGYFVFTNEEYNNVLKDIKKSWEVIENDNKKG